MDGLRRRRRVGSMAGGMIRKFIQDGDEIARRP